MPGGRARPALPGDGRRRRSAMPRNPRRDQAVPSQTALPGAYEGTQALSNRYCSGSPELCGVNSLPGVCKPYAKGFLGLYCQKEAFSWYSHNHGGQQALELGNGNALCLP
ncbi:unnamed protein product [Bubo scandiacus]